RMGKRLLAAASLQIGGVAVATAIVVFALARTGRRAARAFAIVAQRAGESTVPAFIQWHDDGGSITCVSKTSFSPNNGSWWWRPMPTTSHSAVRAPWRASRTLEAKSM